MRQGEAVSYNEEVFDEVRKAMLEVGRGLKNHLKKSSERKKAKEKFELVNIILPRLPKSHLNCWEGGARFSTSNHSDR